MVTFSSGTTVANQLPGLINIVQVLPDNTAKVITPKNFRDSVFTLWENSMFKPTTVSESNIYYVGIDQYQVVKSDGTSIYPKVYFGKKQTGGQFIMSDAILSRPEVDFFFYNTRDNSGGNYDTAIAILAGTQSFLINNEVAAPILKSTVVSSANGPYLNLNILNTSYVTDGVSPYGGDINLLSSYGKDSLNGFSFPKLEEHIGVPGQSKNDYVLKYKWVNNEAIGVWESAFSQSITSINYPQGQVTITGNPIVLTGYRFTDTNIVATGIGGIRAGETFNNVDVLDMIRRIVYTYIPPVVTSSFTLNGAPISLLETGDGVTLGNIRLNYKVTVNATHSVQTFNIIPLEGNVTSTPTPFPSVLTRGDKSFVATLGFNPLIPSAYKIYPYTFSITDNYPTNATYSNKLTVVLPYFYGSIATFSNTSAFLKPGAADSGLNDYLGINPTAPVGKLNSILVEPIIGSATYSNNLRLNITTQGLGTGFGKGWIYFGYPSEFPPIKSIRDSNGLSMFNIMDPGSSAFATFSANITNQQNPFFWNSRDYTFYISKNETTYGYNPVPWDFMFVTQSNP